MLKVSEVFTSIEGEVSGHHQGRITTFIRLYGCNLECSYCDTEYARKGGKYEEVDFRFLASRISTPNVTVTGGEPLLQPEVKSLLSLLLSQEKFVTIETNGTLGIPVVCRHPAVSIVMDHKIPGDFYTGTTFKENQYILSQKDVVKFVIWNRFGFDYVLENKHKYPTVGLIALSACEPYVEHSQLLDWMLNSELVNDHRVVVNVQLHKLIGAK